MIPGGFWGLLFVDRVKEEFATTEAELISTNMSAEQEERLRMAFESEG